MGDPPLRLLYVSHSFPPSDQPLANVGGMQRVATELYDAFQHHPEVAMSDLLLRTSWRWTHVRTVPFLIKLLVKIPHLVKQQNIDTVLFSSMVTGSTAVYLNERLQGQDVTLAAISHGRDVTLPVGIYQQFVPSVFDALDLVLPVSEATANACRVRGLSPSKCQVVPNGVSPNRFYGTDRMSRDGRPTAEAQLTLCSVGRQVERKGFAWFVRNVMPQLPKHVHYYLAGDGPEHDTIKRTARESNVHGRVHVLGQIPEDELVRLYQSVDLFVMPNIPVSGDMEGFGVVMLEAGVCGVPTIASRLEGIQDVIANDQNGHLVEPGNAEAFAEQIRWYIEHPDGLSEASERTKTYVQEHFTWSAVVDRYVDVLKKPTVEA